MEGTKPRTANSLGMFDFLKGIGMLTIVFAHSAELYPAGATTTITPMTFYLPSLFGVGLRSGVLIYIYIQFFKGLPGELEEAAWIDGAGLFKTFFSIAVPSSSVVFTTVTIFALVWHWNDYYLAIMYLSDNFPLAVKIYDIKNLLTVQKIWDGYPAISTKCAACFMFILPLLLVYLVLQRKFVKSIDRVGITG